MSGGKRFTLDGEPVDIGEFILDNAPEFDGEDVRAIEELKIGEEIVYGGGAQPLARLRRVEPPKKKTRAPQSGIGEIQLTITKPTTVEAVAAWFEEGVTRCDEVPASVTITYHGHDKGDGAEEVRLPRERIFGEVDAERTAQDAQWGGPAHDDKHTPEGWLYRIDQQAGKFRYEDAGGPGAPNADARARFVKIAALATAAVESIDRCCARLRALHAEEGRRFVDHGEEVDLAEVFLKSNMHVSEMLAIRDVAVGDTLDDCAIELRRIA